MSEQASGKPDYDVAVIGAGFGGLYAIHRLVQLGFSVVGLERGAEVGGVWHWNRYPGARCDCESYYYSYSFSDDLQRDWSWSLRYSEQPEILRYLDHVADRFEVRPRIRFGTKVTGLEFDEDAALWRVEYEGKTVGALTARFVVAATGCLSEKQRPPLPGLDQFTGRVFYTADWPAEGVDLAGQRVGVVGTGASGVQVISRIAPAVAHLTVFQRTANWVLPVWNGPTTAEFDAWTKAHHREFRSRCLNSPGGLPYDPPRCKVGEVSEAEQQQILEEYWRRGGIQILGAFSDIFRNVTSNDVVANFVRRKIHEIVTDPRLAEKLTPNDHPIGSKRPPMDDHYYATFNRPNVSLVDIRQSPIIGFAGRSLQTTDSRHELDTLILATGFDAITGALLAIDVRGRGGRSLRNAWASGARTYLGLSVAGFPNLFTITGPLSPSVFANMPTAVEQHVDWIAECLARMREDGLNLIEAEEEAQQAWVSSAAEVVRGTVYERANSWYLGANIPGKTRQFALYLGGFGRYRHICDDVAEGGYRGFARSAV